MVDIGLWLTVAQLTIELVINPTIDRKKAEHAFRTALEQAYKEFSKEYPGLSQSFFDKTFIKKPEVTREFSKLLTANDNPDIHKLSAIWKEQFFSEPSENINQAIKYFLDRLQAAIRNQPELHPQAFGRDLRQLNQRLEEHLTREFTDRAVPHAILDAILDSAPEPPTYYIYRQKLIKEIEENLRKANWTYIKGRPGTGKTLVAREIHARTKPSWWISLRNTENPKSHFYQQIWLRLRGDNPGSSPTSVAELVNNIENVVDDKLLIIVDNLPDPVEIEDFLLDVLVRLAKSQKIKVLTTSQYDLLDTIRFSNSNYIQSKDIPSLSASEVVDLLVQANAPEEFLVTPTIRLLYGYTDGHPGLCQAVIHWLIDNDWKADLLGAILEDEPIKDYLSQKRRQLLHLLDESNRRFVYRLSIIHDEFNKELAQNVAEVSPPITFPNDRIDRLTGPWIEKIAQDRFSLSQLLKNAWEHNLSRKERLNIHIAVTNYYLRDNVIDVSKASQIAFHIAGTGDTEQLALFIIALLKAAKSPDQYQHIEWAILSLSSDTDLYNKLSYTTKLILRGQQIKGAKALNRSVDKYYNDIIQILEHETENYFLALNVLHFVAQIHLTKLPVRLAGKCLQKAIRDADPDIMPAGTMSDLTPYDIIWLIVGTSEDIEYIASFFSEILSLPDETVNDFFDSEFAIETTTSLTDRFCSDVANKPEPDRDWTTSLDLISNLEENISGTSALPLRVALKRAKAIIYGNYLKDHDRISDILSSPPLGLEGDLAFLDLYTKGVLLHDNYRFDEALKILSLIDPTQGEAFEYYRSKLPLYLGICLANIGRIDEAKSRFITAIRDLKNSTSQYYDFLNVLGELAWLHYTSGDMKKAFCAFQYVIKQLMDSPEMDQPEFRETLRKYISILTRINASYLDPTEKSWSFLSGFFIHTKSELREPSIPTSSYELPLLMGLALFAQLAKLYSKASELYKDCDSLYPPGSYYRLLGYGGEKASLEVYLDRFEDALITAIEFTRTTRLSSIFTNNEKILVAKQFLDQAYNSLPEIERRNFEETAIAQLAAIVFAKACQLDWNDTAYQQTIRMLRQSAQLQNQYFADYNRLDQLLLQFQHVRLQAQSSSAPELASENAPLKATWWLARSNNVSIGEAFQLQVQSLEYFVKITINSVFFDCIVDWLISFWTKTVETQAFRLNAPLLFQRRLDQIQTANPRIAAAEILNMASMAVGITIPDNFVLRKLL